ncbi:MAG: molybdenum cofactor guanylyltransferase [Candidatus Competibacteraceae bacterium]|nr:molybdenum cofactor guanylyltransferase [Candidatus Competibacteraceae bacterium]MBK8898017.1 molybdenum cofactor guanylyltransferase [Candidatus Competibacteraceae bacterium]
MTSAAGKLTGLVLAGGRAERMGGCDKGLLALAGEPLVAHVVRGLRPQVAEVLISANRNVENYRQLGCRVIEDEPRERYQGPLAGILAALRVVETPYLLTAPCDSPFLPPDYARRMQEALDRERASAAVACYEGFRQPVFALLPVGLRDDLSAYLASGERNAGRWLRRHRSVAVEFFEASLPFFQNINTPADLARLASTGLPADQPAGQGVKDG